MTETTKPIACIDDLKAIYIEVKAAAQLARETLAPIEAELAEVIDATTNAHKERFSEAYRDAEQAQATLEKLETALREAVIEHCKANGVKTYDANLGIRENTKYVYENDDAVQWAIQNAPVMIRRTVDKKMFESFLGIGDLDFVKRESTFTAVIKGLEKSNGV